LALINFKNSDIRRTYSTYRRSFKTTKNLNKKIMSYLFWNKKNEKRIIKYRNSVRDITKKIPDYHDNFLYKLIPVVCILTCVELFVDVIIMPVFDIQFGGIPELDF